MLRWQNELENNYFFNISLLSHFLSPFFLPLSFWSLYYLFLSLLPIFEYSSSSSLRIKKRKTNRTVWIGWRNSQAERCVFRSRILWAASNLCHWNQVLYQPIFYYLDSNHKQYGINLHAMCGGDSEEEDNGFERIDIEINPSGPIDEAFVIGHVTIHVLHYSVLVLNVIPPDLFCWNHKNCRRTEKQRD